MANLESRFGLDIEWHWGQDDFATVEENFCISTLSSNLHDQVWCLLLPIEIEWDLRHVLGRLVRIECDSDDGLAVWLQSALEGLHREDLA